MIQRGVTVDTLQGRLDITVDISALVENGVCLEENAAQVARFVEAYVSFLGDSPLTKPQNLKPGKLIRKFLRELTSKPVKDLILRFSGLAEQITTTCYTTGESSLTGSFVDGMRDTPVFKEYLAFYHSGSPRILQFLLSFLKFGKKMQYLDESLHQVAFRDWLGVEDRLRNLSLPHYVSDIKTLMRQLLPGIRTSAFYPKFGPGAVANRGVRGSIAKANYLRYSPLIDHAFFSPYFKGAASVPSRDRVIPNMALWDVASSHEDTVAEFRFVPKDVSKSRSICMEPNTNMYFQQLVHDWMKDAINGGPLGKYIHLDDQTFNREAANHGSLYGSVDTIDLSSASDSVSIELIKAVFPPDFLYYMLATRTKRVRLPNKEIMDVVKFAPMGSAVCFPTQCILFCTIVLYAMMLYDTHTEVGGALPEGVLSESSVRSFLTKRVFPRFDWFTPFRSIFECPQVFGDDIVCDSRVTDLVTHILSDLGFVVNESKSYRGSQAIRESCGEWYYFGDRITPYTYRVELSGKVLTPTAYCSLIAAVNNAGDFGYTSLRRTLLRYALYSPLRGVGRSTSFGVNLIRFVSNREEFGIFSKDVRNPHLRRRPHKGWQLDTVFCVRPEVKQKLYPDDLERDSFEHYLYLQDVRTRYYTVVQPLYTSGSVRYRPEDTRLVERWIPDRE
jgi:hypothetical protein